jgi:serine protease inhibitor
MKLYSETKLVDFQAWSGAIDTKNTIIDHDKAEEFDDLIDEIYPDGLSETQLNDILWFDDEWIFETLGIKINEL